MGWHGALNSSQTLRRGLRPHQRKICWRPQKVGIVRTNNKPPKNPPYLSDQWHQPVSNILFNSDCLPEKNEINHQPTFICYWQRKTRCLHSSASSLGVQLQPVKKPLQASEMHHVITKSVLNLLAFPKLCHVKPRNSSMCCGSIPQCYCYTIIQCYIILYPMIYSFSNPFPGSPTEKKNSYPLVICYIAIENGHRNT